jgi:hypothetical protein
MKYRKKPVVIDAFRFAVDPAPAWWTKAVDTGGVFVHKIAILNEPERVTGVTIHTLQGHFRAAPGDWIVQGVKGEIYPVAPAIFDFTYEMVSD